MTVGKSGRLRLVVEGKTKRTSREEITQWESSDSLLKGKEPGRDEAGKETNWGQDPLTSH